MTAASPTSHGGRAFRRRGSPTTRLRQLGALLPHLLPHLVRTTPWATLVAGCLTGTTALWLLRAGAAEAHRGIDQTTVRLTVLPAVAAVAFVPRTSFRPLVDATPVPTWVTAAARTALALPVLATTFWAQILVLNGRTGSGPVLRATGVHPLVAELTGWTVATLAVAACCDRTRVADLGGAVAAPISLALIAVAAFGPGLRELLTSPPASAPAVTTAWYAVSAVALVVCLFAVRDVWHRYALVLRRGL